MATEDIAKRITQQAAPETTGGFIALFGLALADRMNPTIVELNEQVDTLEEKVDAGTGQSHISELSELRRGAILLRRYLAPQRDALNTLSLQSFDFINESDRLKIREAADQATRINEELDAIRERCAIVKDQLVDQRSEEMNRNMMAKSLSTLQYLDKALGGLRELGLLKGESDPVPIITLLNQINDIDPDKVTAIARTLDQASYFNEVVREQVSNIKVAERYEGITTAFNSIRDDSKALVDQYADGKINTIERFSNIWMKMTRGSIASRFGKIKELYLDVAMETKNQIEREQLILEAYMDFRGAMKNSEVLSFDVLKKATKQLETKKTKVTDSVAALDAADKRYQISKDLSDNLTVGYNTSEVVMSRLVQMRNAKERVYAQSISFFGTNEVVLTALTATLTGMHGLHESTQTLNAMKKGIEDSLEVLAEVGDHVQEAAIKAGYGPTVSAAAVKKLLDSVVAYQERSQDIIAEMRVMATDNSAEIRTIVEDGKRRLARLAETGAATTLGLI